MKTFFKWIKKTFFRHSIDENEYQALQDILTQESKQFFETLSYDELLKPAEELSYSKNIEGETYYFSAEHYNTLKNGDIAFCIDIDKDGLKKPFSKRPSYNFYKRRDGSVYY